jgi:uncharacterized protein YacL (UPF0231 family)|tara:strand:+ start:6819 stop:7169 length:351 start_codon:yes stop_codon:yes gene_type:complete
LDKKLDSREILCYTKEELKRGSSKMVNNEQTKRAYAKQYINSLQSIEEEMEVYKEQKRELRDEYRESGWLTTHEIAATVRAYRIVVQANKGQFDLDEFFENIKMFANESRSSTPGN